MKVPFTNRGEKGSYLRFGRNYFFDRLPRNFLLKEELPSAVSHVCDGVVLIVIRDTQGRICFGTGLILGGSVLTALHVVRDAETIGLKYKEGDIGAREIARNKDLDFALLEPEKLLSAPSVVLARKYALGHGELYAVGHLSFREAREGKTNTYRRRLCAYKIKRALRETRQGKFAAAVPSAGREFFGGFSGGVLVDSYGVIIGMLQAIAEETKWILGVIPRHRYYITGAWL